jgi:hypothetical protein
MLRESSVASPSERDTDRKRRVSRSEKESEGRGEREKGRERAWCIIMIDIMNNRYDTGY